MTKSMPPSTTFKRKETMQPLPHGRTVIDNQHAFCHDKNSFQQAGIPQIGSQL